MIRHIVVVLAAARRRLNIPLDQALDVATGNILVRADTEIAGDGNR